MSEPNVYSFSRLGTFQTCPFAYNEKYNNGYIEGDSGWTLGGTHAHSIVEGILKGEIDPKDAPDLWINETPKFEFPTMRPKYIHDYVQSIHQFFTTFKGINNEILNIERHFKIQIDGIWFQGFVDLETKTDEHLSMIDWKTSSISGFSGKKLKEKARQLYLYSESMKEHYGSYPKEMFFYMLKYRKAVKIDFNKKDLQEAKDWLKSTVEQIESEKTWAKKPDAFWCRSLCQIKTCEFNGNYNDINNNT